MKVSKLGDDDGGVQRQHYRSVRCITVNRDRPLKPGRAMLSHVTFCLFKGLIFVCTCSVYGVCVSVHSCAVSLLWRSEDSLVESVFSLLLYVDSGNQTQVIRFARQVFYLLSHPLAPTGP